MSYDLFLFDFDGVLFNTNRIKTEAFQQALAGYPEEAVAEFVAYHEATGGISRYVKVAHFFSQIMQRIDNTQQEQAEVLEKFADIAPRLMAAASPLPGAPEFLGAIAQGGRTASVCSGGNSNEIKTLLERHQLAQLIDNIWGNERSKKEHAADSIVNQYAKVIFFGDGQYDMEVAQAFGFDFVFVASLTDWPEGREIAQANGHRVIEDFNDPWLKTLLES